MILLVAAVSPSSAVQAATSSSDLHFGVTLAVIGFVGAVLGWLIKRLVGSNDDRYTGLVTELHDTNIKLNTVAENLANLTGQLQGMEKANVTERHRVQRNEGVGE